MLKLFVLFINSERMQFIRKPIFLKTFYQDFFLPNNINEICVLVELVVIEPVFKWVVKKEILALFGEQ